MPLSFCASSHPGVRRETNEDSFCARPDLGLFVVADGVGGYAAGEVASRAAVDAIEQAIAETMGWDEDTTWPFEYQPGLGVDGNRLNWAFHLANIRIRTEIEAARGRQGMATTLVAVLFPTGGGGPKEPIRGATIGHLGDSRIYRFRDSELARLTQDHSWVEEQVRAGILSQQEARAHPRRNLLTRALTGGAEPSPDFGWVPTSDGDRLLLCTDGLCGVLTDEQMAKIIAQDVVPAVEAEKIATDQTVSDRTVPSGLLAAALKLQADAPPPPPIDPAAAEDDTGPRHPPASDGPQTVRMAHVPGAGNVCEALIHAANLAGGPDNITAVLVRL